MFSQVSAFARGGDATESKTTSVPITPNANDKRTNKGRELRSEQPTPNTSSPLPRSDTPALALTTSQVILVPQEPCGQRGASWINRSFRSPPGRDSRLDNPCPFG